MTTPSLTIDDAVAEGWMRDCLGLARHAATEGNYALGAAVVRPGQGILARSSSSLLHVHDPTAHPELLALRLAAEQEGSRYLTDAYLVSTLEPCVMCTGAAIWAKLRGVIFGAFQGDALAWAAKHPDPLYTWRQIQITCQEVVDQGIPRLEVKGGVLRDECRALFDLNLQKP